jgi:hypothetical protein
MIPCDWLLWSVSSLVFAGSRDIALSARTDFGIQSRPCRVRYSHPGRVIADAGLWMSEQAARSALNAAILDVHAFQGLF